MAVMLVRYCDIGLYLSQSSRTGGSLESSFVIRKIKHWSSWQPGTPWKLSPINNNATERSQRGDVRDKVGTNNKNPIGVSIQGTCLAYIVYIYPVGILLRSYVACVSFHVTFPLLKLCLYRTIYEAMQYIIGRRRLAGCGERLVKTGYEIWGSW